MTTVILHTLLRSIEYIVKKSLHSFTSLSCWDAHCEIVVIIVFLKQELLKFFKRFFYLKLIAELGNRRGIVGWQRGPCPNRWPTKRRRENQIIGCYHQRYFAKDCYLGFDTLAWPAKIEIEIIIRIDFYSFVFKVVNFIYLLDIS